MQNENNPAGNPPYGVKSKFKIKVLEIVKTIPRGKTITYKKVAEMAGNKKAFRAVGNILNKNYDPKIPCHRLIKSNGKIGGYNRGVKKKDRVIEKRKSYILIFAN